MPYLGRSHLPYAIAAILVVVLFVLTPGILLLLYPLRLFQRFLNLFPIRWHILHTFVDSYQGCYKDGTEPGTRDCRGFASLLFLFYMHLCLLQGLNLLCTERHSYNTGCSVVHTSRAFQKKCQPLLLRNCHIPAPSCTSDCEFSWDDGS